MKKWRSYKAILSILVLALVAVACSKEKSGFTNRMYHNTTSHYNWYFNANEIMRLTELELWTNKQDNYHEILPIYIIPDDEGQKNLTPSMDEIIEKCSTIIDRHSMEIKRTEHNKWIDETFFLMGKANYYKGKFATAQEMFSYVSKKYKDQETRHYAALWSARTYIEEQRYGKAATTLTTAEKSKATDKPKDFDAQLETVYADLYLRQERYEEALIHLDNAARMTKDKDMKARLTFIYAQVNQHLNKSKDAVEGFAKVVKLRPDYEMEFYARINQALSYDRKLDASQIKKMLWDMAKDDKNVDYYDQIYYALAEIELADQNIEEGINLLQTSAAKSINNPRQKGRTYLRLAEIYFVEREYVLAKNYYDSTATFLPEDYPDYHIILATGASLNELVTNIQIVEYNDSVISLATMDEKERDKKLLKMIAQLEEEEDAKRQAELDALERMQNAPPSRKGSGSDGRTWYFYNTSTLSSGYQEFQRKWGSRKLEDNWRRSTRNEFVENSLEMGADSDSLMANLGQQESNVKSLDEYLSELPTSDSALTSAHNEIIAALYAIGTIYAEKLKDDDNAIESFLRITNEYDTSATALPAYYQLYRIYVQKEEKGGFVGTGFKDNSDYYKNVILADYPDSEFAKLILDPTYVTAKNQRYEEEKEKYEQTYKKFNRRQYSDVLVTCNNIINEEPDNNFLAKYYLIKALTIGAQRSADAYEDILREIIAKFRGTPEADKAAELLGELNSAKARLARGETPQDDDDAPADPAGDDPAAGAAPSDVDFSMFKEDDDSEHFFALVFAKTEDDATSLKNTISDFNTEYFRSENLRITNSFIDKDHQIIIVRSFANKEEALRYYNSFYTDSGLLKEINRKNHDKFVITTKNFTVLFRNKNTDVYKAFFDAKYD